MSSRYEECLAMSQALADYLGEMEEEINCVAENSAHISFFGFDGLELMEEINSLKGQVEEFKEQVKGTRATIQKVARHAQFEADEISEIGEIWQAMVETAKTCEATLQQAAEEIKVRSLWVAILSALDDLFESFRTLVVNLARPIFHQASNLLKSSARLFLPAFD